jgi:hypothetical protein
MTEPGKIADSARYARSPRTKADLEARIRELERDLKDVGKAHTEDCDRIRELEGALRRVLAVHGCAVGDPHFPACADARALTGEGSDE